MKRIYHVLIPISGLLWYDAQMAVGSHELPSGGSDMSFVTRASYNFEELESEFASRKPLKKLSLDLRWDYDDSKPHAYAIVAVTNLGTTKELVVPISPLVYFLEAVDRKGRKSEVGQIPPILQPAHTKGTMVLLYPKSTVCGSFKLPLNTIRKDLSYRVKVDVNYHAGYAPRSPLVRFRLTSSWSKLK